MFVFLFVNLQMLQAVHFINVAKQKQAEFFFSNNGNKFWMIDKVNEGNRGIGRENIWTLSAC